MELLVVEPGLPKVRTWLAGNAHDVVPQGLVGSLA